MSWAALAWAVRQKLPSTQKLVLIMLAERHNGDTGRCDPSHSRLAEDCGLSARSIVDQLAKLEEAGYLRALGRANGQVRMSNYYVLNLNFGVQQEVKSVPDDPFLVLNDVQGGTERASGGVLNDVQGGTERRAHKPVNEPGIEPNTKKVPKSRAAKPEIEKPEGVTDTTWSDWLAHRKAKRAPVTQTALDNIASEAAKASYSLEDALKTCCARGWQGFCADWVQPRHQAQHQQAPRQLQSFAERDREEQMQRWERATGRVHPDRQQQMPRNVIDITPRGETMFLES